MTHPAAALALAIADELADPERTVRPLPDQAWLAQSLWHGMPGIALLHTELAAVQQRPWRRVHDWLAAATARPVTTGPPTNLFHGAPAVAYALATVANDRPGRYSRPLATLDAAVRRDVLRRVGAAHARLDGGQPTRLADFDVIRGLTGVGSYLLRREPAGEAMRVVLEYFVRLADPVTSATGRVVPGWWTPTGPSGYLDNRFPDGHLNNGAAHGIAGPLALLGQAARLGILVPGQRDAIDTIVRRLDSWKQISASGIPAWPYWVTPDRLDAGGGRRPAQRPSWCYGTAGIANAIQSAGDGLGDTTAAADAVSALLLTLTDPDDLAATTDASLCHGYAGYAMTAAHISDPELRRQSSALVDVLLSRVLPAEACPATFAAELLHHAGPGLLDGAAGIALGCWTATNGAVTDWDTCFLLNGRVR